MATSGIVHETTLCSYVIVLVFSTFWMTVHGAAAATRAPHIVTHPRDNILLEDNRETLSCSAYGSLPLEYRWKKDDVFITELAPTGFHRIDDIQRSDAGDYQCVVQNEAGSVLSKAAEIRVAYIEDFQGQASEATVEEGNAVVLTCPPIESFPKPDITWQKDGYPISLGLDKIQTFDDRLVILAATGIAGGQYSCRAFNPNSGVFKDSSIITLRVTGIGSSPTVIAPTIVIPPTHTTIKRGDTLVKLQCIANAKPLNALTYTWRKNGVVVSVDTPEYIHNYPNENDEGIYECEVQLPPYAFSPVKATANITMQTAPVWLFTPPAVTSGEVGFVTDILCQASGMPKPTYTWYKDAVKISSLNENRYVVQPTGSLRITNIQPEDGGIFQCFASNDVDLLVADTWLQVQSIPPSIIQPPNDTYVIDSFSARMTCRVSGAPQPKITWMKGDTIIASDTVTLDRFILSDNGDLLISQALKEDTGRYMCVATNPIGSVNASAMLTVQIRTRIVVHPQNTNVVKGYTAKFQCDVVHDANIAIRIIWLKDKVEIDLDSTSRISMQPDGALEIREARSDDIGNYTCKVTSPGGDDERTARLEVSELPYAPGYVQASLNPNRERTIDVEWVPSYNGNRPLVRFIVRMRENSKPWQVVLSNVAPDSTIVSIPNLTPSWRYTFKVCAVNDVGQGPFSDPSNNVTLPEEPPDAPPQGVAVSPRSQSSIMMQWQAPPEEHWNGALLGYQIQYKLAGYDGAPWQIRNITNPQQLSYELKELIKWTNYAIRVAAYNSKGAGSFSPDIEVRTLEAVPTEAPRSATSFAVNSTSIKFSWQEPSAQNIYGVNQGYKMRAWEDTRPDYKIVVVVPPNPLEKIQTGYITGLKKFTEYYTSVLCYTVAGDGPDSTPIRVKTFQDIPGPVGDLSFSEIYDTSLKVSWSPPEEINGILTGYTVGVQEENITETYRSMEVEADTVYHTVTGLTELTRYEITVFAKTQVGPGPPVTSTIDSGVPPELPTEPIDLAISDIQAYKAMLQYTPGHNGKTSINTWKVEAQINRAEEWVTIYEHHDPDAVAFEIPSLKPYSKYRFRLTAINVVGASPPSEPTREIETQQDIPATAPESVTVRAASETSLTVRWIPLTIDQWNGVPLGYRVAWRRVSQVYRRTTNSFQYADIDDYIGRTYIIEDLEEWMAYEVKVRANNEKGSGPYSEAIVERTRDSAPTAGPDNVTATAVDSTTIRVTWDAVPPSDQNGQLLGYKVRYCESGAIPDECEFLDTENNASRNADLTDLRKYVQYDIQVLAYTRIGDGQLSEPPIRVRTLEDVPGPVSGIRFPQVTYTDLTMVWQEPLEPNGEIAGYRVTYRKNSSTEILNSEDLPPTTYNKYVDNLEQQTYYMFTITARSRLGWGEQAQALVLTVVVRDPPQPPYGLLVPQGEVHSHDVTLLWTPGTNGNSPIRYYTIDYRESTSINTWRTHTTNIDASKTTYVIDNLSPYTTYQFCVKAHNDVGASPCSEPSDFVTTLQDLPDAAPTITDVIPFTATSVRIHWQPPPAKNFNGIFRGYKIQYKQLTETTYMEKVVKSQSARQSDLQGLTMFAWYEIVMRLNNRMGDGPASAPATVYVGEAIPTAAPRSVAATVLGPTQIKVTWQQPPEDTQNGGFQGCKVYYVKAGEQGGQEMMRSVTSSTATELVLDRLESYTTYEIQVLCFNAAGDGPRSVPPQRARTEQTYPEAPGPLVFTKITMNAANVTWTAPIRPNGVIMGYQIVYQPAEPIEGTSKIITVDSESPDKQFLWATELAERKTYSFMVMAKTQKGYGPARKGNVTTGPQPGAPSAPRYLKMRTTNSAVILSWAPPNDTGKSPLIRYVIEGYPIQESGYDVPSSWVEVASDVPPTSTSYSISFRNLRSNHRYRFRVMAVNSHSYSLPSMESHVSEKVTYHGAIYDQYWFLIMIGAIGFVLIIMLILLLCMLGRNKRYRGKRRKLHGVDNATVQGDDGGFATFELNHRSVREKSTYSRQPPRPSPASIAYSDEDPTAKYDDAESSSLTEKPSSLGDSTDSGASDSDGESDMKDPHSFVNHYVNDPTRQSWKRQRPAKAYSYTDSEPDIYAYGNGAVVTNGMLNLQPGSRAPLPGFSSFV
ncbi:protein sidekick-2-like isoform X2 [Ptychodera flava]|uniref:protein sidekick-2-like isoform X2 n=1 Tax=Ptychodera flava TaxID=63121 RepID=UPI00396A6978